MAGEVEDAVNSLKNWVKPVYPDVVVFPKQEIALDFTIDVPPNADPGSHWGGVLVRTAPFFTGGGAAIQTRVGTIVLLRVSGEAKEKLAVLLRATYGDAVQELSARRVIWVVPWRSQGWKLLLGIGVLAIVIWKRRRFGRAWYALRTGKPPPEDY